MSNLEEFELPRVSEADLKIYRARIIRSLWGVGFPYSFDQVGLGYGANEYVSIDDFGRLAETARADKSDLMEVILTAKDGFNEIVTNYLTGYVLSGKWKDSYTGYSKSFPFAYPLFELILERIRAGRLGKLIRPQDAEKTLLLTLGYDYMRPADSQEVRPDLIKLLAGTVPEFLPRLIILADDPLNLLDNTIAQYVANHYRDDQSALQKKLAQSQRASFTPAYVDSRTGKIHMIPKGSRPAFHRKMRELVSIHELFHHGSTSIDPETHTGKIGLKRYVLKEQEIEFLDEDN